MTTWFSQPDPDNPGHWRIVNNANGKTVVYGLSRQDADSFVERRNKQERKRQKDDTRTTTGSNS